MDNQIIETVSEAESEISVLQNALSTEKEKRKSLTLQLELIKAGATDADYLIYKTNSDAVFDDECSITNLNDYIKSVKENFPNFFKEREVKGVLPAESIEGQSSGFLTYSQEIKRATF